MVLLLYYSLFSLYRLSLSLVFSVFSAASMTTTTTDPSSSSRRGRQLLLQEEQEQQQYSCCCSSSSRGWIRISKGLVIVLCLGLVSDLSVILEQQNLKPSLLSSSSLSTSTKPKTKPTTTTTSSSSSSSLMFNVNELQLDQASCGLIKCFC